MVYDNNQEHNWYFTKLYLGFAIVPIDNANIPSDYIFLGKMTRSTAYRKGYELWQSFSSHEKCDMLELAGTIAGTD